MHDFLTLSRAAFRHTYMQEQFPAQVRERLPVADDNMLRMVRRHRVAGLWFAAGLSPALQRHAYGQSVASVRCDVEVERIFASLEEVTPSVGLVKGPALARQAWLQSGLRDYDDLDLRFAKNKLDAVSDKLAALGYRPVAGDLNRRTSLWHYGWGVSFINSIGLRVECNHRLFPAYYPVRASFAKPEEDFWTTLRVGRQEIKTLQPSDHLLYCCLHVIWHGWERLSWLVDIAGLLARYPDILELARKRAGTTGFSRRALDAVCYVCEQWFGPFPENHLSFSVDANTTEQAQAFLIGEVPKNRNAAVREIHRELCSPAEWMLSTWKRIATPGDPDFIYWSFPIEKRYLYWLARPLRRLILQKRRT